MGDNFLDLMLAGIAGRQFRSRTANPIGHEVKL